MHLIPFNKKTRAIFTALCFSFILAFSACNGTPEENTEEVTEEVEKTTEGEASESGESEHPTDSEHPSGSEHPSSEHPE